MQGLESDLENQEWTILESIKVHSWLHVITRIIKFIVNYWEFRTGSSRRSQEEETRRKEEASRSEETTGEDKTVREREREEQEGET